MQVPIHSICVLLLKKMRKNRLKMFFNYIFNLNENEKKELVGRALEEIEKSDIWNDSIRNWITKLSKQFLKTI